MSLSPGPAGMEREAQGLGFRAFHDPLARILPHLMRCFRQASVSSLASLIRAGQASVSSLASLIRAEQARVYEASVASLLSHPGRLTTARHPRLSFISKV